ncbi:hypothetical protein [Pontibacter virosus]|uniref:Uncharacterized protein n=1 Tax=Pontibacter virosus TaxID=1765052 RepID=A0A2U1AWV8_9BACT|nr:hypothetical protein [Pontibacter virosus]PVY40883.1 hypothetical protein C8E01_106225 [Pontibacter virosus]
MDHIEWLGKQLEKMMKERAVLDDLNRINDRLNELTKVNIEKTKRNEDLTQEHLEESERLVNEWQAKLKELSEIK